MADFLERVRIQAAWELPQDASDVEDVDDYINDMTNLQLLERLISSSAAVQGE